MAPEKISTDRLLLRRPRPEDVDAVFSTYAGVPAATKYMSFPTHADKVPTAGFLEHVEKDWTQHGVGPYLVFDQAGTLLGSTGIHVVEPWLAFTGYIYGPSAWGKGYATESTLAMVDLARGLGIRRLEATVYKDHVASARVLEKAGFSFEGILRASRILPNVSPTVPCDMRMYAVIF